MRRILVVALLAIMLVSFSVPVWADTSYVPPTLPTGPYGITFQALPANDTFDMPMGQYVISFGSGGKNGGPVPTDAPAYTSLQGRVMVPVRYLADALGAQTSWDASTETVTIIKGGTTIVMTVGSKTLTVNGKTSQMDVAPVIGYNGKVSSIYGARTYLPARYVAEALGATVNYDQYTYFLNISVDGFTDFPAGFIRTS